MDRIRDGPSLGLRTLDPSLNDGLDKLLVGTVSLPIAAGLLQQLTRPTGDVPSHKRALEPTAAHEPAAKTMSRHVHMRDRG